MGIDPVSHKPKNDTLLSNDGGLKSTTNLSHMAQWESARLEAEARLVKQSKFHSMSPSPFPNKLNSSVCSLTSAFGPPPTYLKEILHEENDHENLMQGLNKELIVSTIDNTWRTQPLQSSNNNEEHVPNCNFLEHFTDLLLCSSNFNDRCSYMKGDNSDFGIICGEKFNGPSGNTKDSYQDKNKNYWDNILHVMNSSSSNSLMF